MDKNLLLEALEGLEAVYNEAGEFGGNTDIRDAFRTVMEYLDDSLPE